LQTPLEEAKPDKERGTYLHPELFGAGPDKAAGWRVNGASQKQFRESKVVPLTK